MSPSMAETRSRKYKSSAIGPTSATTWNSAWRVRMLHRCAARATRSQSCANRPMDAGCSRGTQISCRRPLSLPPSDPEEMSSFRVDHSSSRGKSPRDAVKQYLDDGDSHVQAQRCGAGVSED